MLQRQFRQPAATALILATLTVCRPIRAQEIATANAAAPDAIEVQARGPIHEAFAQPIDPASQPPLVVPRQPPDPVPEEPPELRPEGENVQWIPGYWAWDGDHNDFLWVSGVWRNVPPGETFVPGYWNQDNAGWRWIPGYWTATGQGQVSYLPAPPASLDRGPSAPAPAADEVYVPGNWVYQPTGYAWQPGCWVTPRPGLVWVPAHYLWTPAGYLFIPGYWDYPLEDRGLLFAPVVFRQPLWLQTGWVYRPAYAVESAPLLTTLFVGPGTFHYWFGDYYRSTRYQPWCLYGASRYDPLFSYYRFRYRGEPEWEAGLRRVYVDRAAGRLAAPAATLRQQNVLVQSTTVNNLNVSSTLRNQTSLNLVAPLGQGSTGRARLTSVTPAQRQAQRKTVEAAHTTQSARRHLETRARATDPTTAATPQSSAGNRPPATSRPAPAGARPPTTTLAPRSVNHPATPPVPRTPTGPSPTVTAQPRPVRQPQPPPTARNTTQHAAQPAVQRGLGGGTRSATAQPAQTVARPGPGPALRPAAPAPAPARSLSPGKTVTSRAPGPAPVRSTSTPQARGTIHNQAPTRNTAPANRPATPRPAATRTATGSTPAHGNQRSGSGHHG